MILNASGEMIAQKLISPKNRGVLRLRSIREEFYSWLLPYANQIEHVCMEGYAFSRQMAHSIGEGGGVIKLVLLDLLGERKAAFPSFATTGQIKKFATSNGSADKNLVLKAVYKKWGVDFDDDNVSDAYTAARIALALMTGTTSFAYEREVVEAMAKPSKKMGSAIHREMPPEMYYA